MTTTNYLKNSINQYFGISILVGTIKSPLNTACQNNVKLEMVLDLDQEQF